MKKSFFINISLSSEYIDAGKLIKGANQLTSPVQWGSEIPVVLHIINKLSKYEKDCIN